MELSPGHHDASLRLISEAHRHFRQVRTHTQLTLLLVEYVARVLEHEEFALLRWDTTEAVFRCAEESPLNLMEMGCENPFAPSRSQWSDGKAFTVETGQGLWRFVPFAGPSGFDPADSKTGFLSASGATSENTAGAIACREGKNQEKEPAIELLCRLWLSAEERLALWGKSRELGTELRRALHSLSVLRKVGQAAGEAHDLQHLLQLILRVAIATISAERGFIMLESETGGELELKVVQGLGDPEAEKAINSGRLRTSPVPRGEGIQGQVLSTREPIILHEVKPETALASGLGSVWTGRGSAGAGDPTSIHSLMCVPLCMKEDAFGVLYVTGTAERRAFDNEDLGTLRALASHAAASIHQARLFNLASTDDLTGLYTRRYYSRRVSEEMKRARRCNRGLSLLVLDLDDFKTVNDTHGHEAGDRMLRHVSAIIRSCIRCDLDFATRYGGEEFLLVLPETDMDQARRVAERIRVTVAGSCVEMTGGPVRLTVSIGVASLQGPADDPEKIFARADAALYQSKRLGKNRVSTSLELSDSMS